MKYLRSSFVLKEHPKYISLAFEITNCPHRCEGCHSPELQKDIGIELNHEILIKTIKKYEGLFQNVIFMGGDHEPDKLVELLKICKNVGLKTTLWTGKEAIDPWILEYIDYIKTGKYDKEKGGLDSPNTNQKYYEVKTGNPIKIK